MSEVSVSDVVHASRSGDLGVLQRASLGVLKEVADELHLMYNVLVCGRSVEVVEWLVQRSIETGVDLCWGWDVLHLAALQGDVQVLRAAGKEGLEGASGGLVHLLHAAGVGGHVEVVDVLVREFGARVEAIDGKLRNPVLLTVAQYGHADAIVQLAEHGCNLEYSTTSGDRAVHIAAKGGHVQVIALLHDLGCDVHAPGSMGRKAVWFAAAFGHVEVVRLLLDLGATVRAEHGVYEPVCAAASGSHTAVVKLLLQHGGDPDANQMGFYALHSAAMSGNEELVRALLQAGARRDILSYSERKSPRDLAVKRGHDGVVALLDGYFPVVEGTVQVLLGLRGAEDSALVRLAQHELFDARVLSLVKCLLTGEENGALDTLLAECE